MPAISYPIEILHLTDPHILPAPGNTIIGVDTANSLNMVLRQAVHGGQNFDLCLVTGDLVQFACEEAYLCLLAMLERYNLDFTCLPGNHDNPTMMRNTLVSPTVNCKKQQFLGNWQIICLDSSVPNSDGGYLAPAEMSFLEACLADHPSLHALIAVHHHCIPTQSKWMDTMIIGNAAEFLALLDKYPQAKAIINGHIHQQMETKKNALQVFTSPSTCFQFAPFCSEFKLDSTMPGYRRLQLYTNGEIATEVLRLPGKGALAGLETQIHGY